ncbi:DUF6455 family protein [Breoghania sp. L-A4]|uniref:DUF6455 family protein n=1 Tax=Breoghania sp. L-A4 TaxID=2304600 RepID=UPI000E359FC1|nr:DUF6455 family protein [Breoghania sp. L-A4]AXS40288.1 hypothetical protein D1F64_09740 [Breoghania sp. L-A4]
MSFFKRADERMSLMGEMMERTGVDLSTGAGPCEESFLRRSISACMHCGAVTECKQWMTEEHDTPPTFCPNSRRFSDHIAAR